MFTGIITDLAEVIDVKGKGDVLLRVKTAYDVKLIPMGASIAHNGICLTVIESGPGWYTVQASAETISTTTLGSWKTGTRINLERPTRVGDELGGDIFEYLTRD